MNSTFVDEQRKKALVAAMKGAYNSSRPKRGEENDEEDTKPEGIPNAEDEDNDDDNDVKVKREDQDDAGVDDNEEEQDGDDEEEDDAGDDDDDSSAHDGNHRRTSLSRSAKKATSYKEVTSIPVMYYNNNAQTKRKPKSPTSQSPKARSDGAQAAAPASDSSTSGTPPTKPPGKKVFFNHSVVQDTIWKALTDLGWKTTKPYKTQRNYHPPSKSDGSRTRVFDSIGRVMDFVRSDPEWRDNERIQEGLTAYEKATGDVGGSTSFTPKNKGLGTPRTKLVNRDAEPDEAIFKDTIWTALQGIGWKELNHEETHYYIKAPATESADQEAGGDENDSPKTSDVKTAELSTEASPPVEADDQKTSATNGTNGVAPNEVAMKQEDSENNAEFTENSNGIDPIQSEANGASNDTPKEESEENKDSSSPVKGELGVDYFDSFASVIEYVRTTEGLQDADVIKDALQEYSIAMGQKPTKRKTRRGSRGSKGPPAKKLKKGASGLNKPRPHKFSNPIMQETIWKALSEAGWTTARRTNSSQRNYFPPKGCGSRRAVYQTITAVLDYVRTDMEWMLNASVQVALKTYDQRLAVALGAKAPVGGPGSPAPVLSPTSQAEPAAAAAAIGEPPRILEEDPVVKQENLDIATQHVMNDLDASESLMSDSLDVDATIGNKSEVELSTILSQSGSGMSSKIEHMTML